MKLVIRPHRPRQRVLVGIGIVLTVIAATATAFHYGHWRSIVESMSAASLKRGIIDDYAELKQHNEELLNTRAKLKRVAEIDKSARVDQQKSISAMQSEIADLKLELAFYRNILSSTVPATGPHVQGFKLREYGGEGRYQYRLVLTHVNKDDKVANGYVDVEIRGQRGDTTYKLALADLAEPNSGDLAFNFKHFRRIEGVLQLPDDFAPEEVHVAVYEDGRKNSSFNKIYDWAKVIN